MEKGSEVMIMSQADMVIRGRDPEKLSKHWNSIFGSEPLVNLESFDSRKYI